MYRSFVGEAMTLLKEGKSDEEATRVLWLRYAAEFAPGYREEQEFEQNIFIPKPARPCRKTRTGSRKHIRARQEAYEELLL